MAAAGISIFPIMVFLLSSRCKYPTTERTPTHNSIMPRIVITASKSSGDNVIGRLRAQIIEQRRVKQNFLVDGLRVRIQNRRVLDEYIRTREHILETSAMKTKDEMDDIVEISRDRLGLEMMRVLTEIYSEISELEKSILDARRESEAAAIIETDTQFLARVNSIRKQPLFFKTLEMTGNGESMNPAFTMNLAGFALLCGILATVLVLRN